MMIEMNNITPENENLKNNLIKNIIETRKAKKISQRKLATLTNMHYAAIARFENLKFNPTLKTLFKITNALNLKIELKTTEEKENMEVQDENKLFL